MALSFKTKKSCGIPVSAAAHKDLRAGDAARDRSQWEEAAAAYARALKLEPELTHIWIQLGHAEAMRGHRNEAEAAYLKAVALNPADPDPLIHIGHRRKDAGDLVGAARFFLDAARRDGGNLGAAGELQGVIARILPTARADLRRILAAGIEDEGVPGASAGTPWLDVSRLVAAMLDARDPLAAEREEADRIAALMERMPLRACAHVEGDARWLAIRPGQLSRIVARSRAGSGGAGAEQAAAALGLELVFASTAAFEAGDRLLYLGTGNPMPNHGLFVAAARSAGAVYVAAAASGLAPELVPDVPLAGGDVAAALQAPAGSLPAAASAVRPPLVPGALAGFGIGQHGLALRTGMGWMSPGPHGSWTHASGAEIVLAVPDGIGPLRISVMARGLPSRSGHYHLLCDDGSVVEGELAAGETSWIVARHVAAEAGIVRLMFKGDEAEAVAASSGARPVNVSAALVGIHVCAESDIAARAQLLEAVVMGDLDWT